MIAILSFLLAGVLVGWLLRARRMKFLGYLLAVLVLFLLFFLGLEIGADPDVVSNLPALGGRAFVIALCAILGSVLFAWLLQRFENQRKKKQE